MVSEGEAVGGNDVIRQSNHEYDFKHPLKRNPRDLAHPFYQVRAQQAGAIYEPGNLPSLDTLPTRTLRNSFLLLISYLV